MAELGLEPLLGLLCVLLSSLSHGLMTDRKMPVDPRLAALPLVASKSISSDAVPEGRTSRLKLPEAHPKDQPEIAHSGGSLSGWAAECRASLSLRHERPC